MESKFYFGGFYLLAGLIVGALIATLIFYSPVQSSVQPQQQSVEVKHVDDSVAVKKDSSKVAVFSSVKRSNPNKELNEKNLYAELVKQGVKHPKIVLAQAKLETGNFSSDVCNRHHNLFGLKHSNGYYRFKRWQESVTAYRDKVQYRYKGGDYFAFLDRIGYADEPKYNDYVRALM